MAKPLVKTCKSYRDGHIGLRVKADARGRNGGETVSASISVDLDAATAKALHAELGIAIEQAEAKLAAKVEAEARRKAWRDREVAAGRMKIISFHSN